MKRVEEMVTIENGRIFRRNFSGEEGQYNRKGDRNFVVFLDPEIATVMARDGWNVKYLKPREDTPEDEPAPILQVSIGDKGRPPLIVMISSRGRTDMDLDTVEMLDWVDIANVDLTIRPYNWVIQEGTEKEERGVKAYLRSMYITIDEDDLDRKYANIPDANPKPQSDSEFDD